MRMDDHFKSLTMAASAILSVASSLIVPTSLPTPQPEVPSIHLFVATSSIVLECSSLPKGAVRDLSVDDSLRKDLAVLSDSWVIGYSFHTTLFRTAVHGLPLFRK